MKKLILFLLTLIAVHPAPAAIQYAGGTTTNFQCPSAAGTKQELSDCFEDELVLAGWTRISGTHSTNVLLQSALTPAGLQMRLNLTQGTNTLILKGRNVTNTKAAAVGQFLLPAIGKTFRVIANQYQYFISTDGTPGARSTAAGGVLYVPAFTGITEAIWTWGPATSDTDTANNPSFKFFTGLQNCDSAHGNQLSIWMVVNGTQRESTSGLFNSSIGSFSFIAPGLVWTRGAATPSYYRWFDGSAFLSEPLVGWSGADDITEARLMGQLWGAAWITDAAASELTFTFDSHTWLVWTNAFTGNASCTRGGLVLMVL